MSEHTPGPWKIGESYVEDEIAIRVGDEDTTCIAVVLVIGDHAAEIKEADANARLIAAAPDLLAALEQCEIMFRFFKTADLRSILPGTYEDVVSAIQKAKGEKQNENQSL